MKTQARSGSLGRKIYRGAEIVLVAFGAAIGVAGLALVPQASQMRAAAEIQRTLDVSDANSRFCEKWGLQRGTAEHTGCTVDLNAIRDDEVRYVTAQLAGLL